MNITFSNKAASGKAKAKHAIVVAVDDKLTLGTVAKGLNKQTKGAIEAAIQASDFEGKAGQTETVLAPAGLAADRVLIVGLGKAKDLDILAYQKAGGSVVAALNAAKVKSAEVHLDDPKGTKKLTADEAIAHAAYGARLRSYNFVKYHTTRLDELSTTLDAVKFIAAKPAPVKKIYAELEKVADGVDFTRDLVTEPANVLYPESFAKECKELTKLGVKVEVLTKAQMEKLGMGALLGVAQGSVREAKMVVMQWNGGKKSDKPVAFVGKGVTFDTGGISIKPSNGMEDMKYDMGGAGVVSGVMKAVAGREAKANVVGIIGCVENMPDGNAQRPGDVVTSMSGQTIEVLNTDAEGRLVLADALWYTQDRFKPQYIVDLATLTGAIMVALGDVHCGLFSNSDDLCKKLNDASDKTGEKIWRLPMGDAYDKQINSQIADMQNIGIGRGAGSITAAQFLQRFVNDTPWAHLDIAAVTWSGKGDATAPKGATGFGVRLLNQFVKDNFEG